MKRVIALFAAVLLSAPVWADNIKEAQKAIRMRNFEQAFLLYRTEARAGNLEAQYQTGKMYGSGMGTQKDRAKAAFWYEKASKAGHPAAQYNLAVILMDSDKERAVSLLNQAAEQKYQAARKLLNKLDQGDGKPELSDREALFFAAKKMM